MPSSDDAPPSPEGWDDIEATAAAYSVADASMMSFRPPQAGAPPESLDTVDPDSTAYWLMQSSQEPSPVTVKAAPLARPLRIVEQIGQGGMGAVFKAVQTGLGREVAVKRVTVNDPGAVAQFVAEAKITGLVEHANVVPIHSLSHAEDGKPQIAMKLVGGTTMRDQISAGDQELEDLVRVLIQVCHALEHAHQRGVIHRDIKPENVMVGDFGQVFVLDWGIAVGLDEDMCLERGLLFVEHADAPAGTPGYMAPELAIGDGLRQGPCTDVYLLGATLHQVLTGSAPHRGDTLRDVLAAAVVSAPPTYDDDVPYELREVATKAMRTEPTDRYPSVAALREALEAYLEHRFANELAAKGTEVVGELSALIDQVDATPDDAMEQLDEDIHREHAEAAFAFRQALATWEGARGAAEGLKKSASLMLAYALTTRDLPLAERVLRDLDDEDAVARVQALRDAMKGEQAEVDALRDRDRRMDWSNVGPVLGGVFMLGGVLGAAELMATQYVIASGMEHGLLINGGMWIATACIVGLYARSVVKRVALPDSLVSPRMLGTWFAVSLGCLGVGMFNELRPVKLSYDMAYPALLMGVGFVAMALQTRRWLLAPAVAFYAGALAIAFNPTWGYEILATVWLLSMVGVGIGLKSGAELEEGA